MILIGQKNRINRDLNQNFGKHHIFWRKIIFEVQFLRIMTFFTQIIVLKKSEFLKVLLQK